MARKAGDKFVPHPQATGEINEVVLLLHVPLRCTKPRCTHVVPYINVTQTTYNKKQIVYLIIGQLMLYQLDWPANATDFP